MEEEDEKVEIKDQEMDTTTKPAVVVKAPEPNSAFKSFFNSNVSLEALEAEIAASKKQREAVIEVKVEEELQIPKRPQTPPNLLLSPIEKTEPIATVVSKSSDNYSDHHQPSEKHVETSPDLSKTVCSESTSITFSTTVAPAPLPVLSSPTKEIIPMSTSPVTSTLTTFPTQISCNENLEKVFEGVEVQKMVQKFESSATTEISKPIAAAITPTLSTLDNTVINKKEPVVVPEAVPDTKPKVCTSKLLFRPTHPFVRTSVHPSV